MCADEMIDEIQGRVDDFGQSLTSVIQKEYFGDSKKAVELLVIVEQLKIASQNTLTELYEHMDQIKNAQKKQVKVTSFLLHKKNTPK